MLEELWWNSIVRTLVLDELWNSGVGRTPVKLNCKNSGVSQYLDREELVYRILVLKHSSRNLN